MVTINGAPQVIHSVGPDHSFRVNNLNESVEDLAHRQVVCVKLCSDVTYGSFGSVDLLVVTMRPADEKIGNRSSLPSVDRTDVSPMDPIMRLQIGVAFVSLSIMISGSQV